MRAQARIAAAAGILLLTIPTSGCGSGTTQNARTTLVVHAAASLQEPFQEIGEEFETRHDGVEVEFSFAGSSTLVEQIRQGAPADVFASANTQNMDKLVEDELHERPPQDFATNTLMIAVPPANPAGVTDLDSLTEEDLALVICAPEVPCGAATATVEESAGLDLEPDSEEQSVTDVLNKVTSGQADAGMVYATDVIRAGDDVEGIEFPAADSAVNTYPITTVDGSENTALGGEFIDLVLGGAGQSILADHGFAAA